MTSCRKTTAAFAFADYEKGCNMATGRMPHDNMATPLEKLFP